MRHRGISTSLAAAIVLSIGTLMPATAMADDLSVLLYPVIVWPAAALLLLILFVFFVIDVVKMIRRRRGAGPARLGLWTVAVSIGSILLFAAHTLIVEALEGRNRHVDVALVHIAVFAVLAAPTFIVGLMLRRRALRTETETNDMR